MADKAATTNTKATMPDVSNWTMQGRNIRTQMIDGTLFIAVNTKPAAYAGIQPTAKGNVTIASTLGNVSVPETTLKLGVNIYGPPPGV